MDPSCDVAFPQSPGRRRDLGDRVNPVRERVFAGVLTGSFLVLAILGALHHEMWRDELHGWLVARDSANLWNVFQVTRYEAHFVLWRVLLFGITRVTHNPFALQFFNLLLATTTIWIIARFSPFRKLEKGLLSFGYFFFYEYCIIAQDYTMIVLLMVCFCALYPGRARHTLSLSVVLFLLANAAPYGLLIALIFTALLVFDWVRNQGSQSLRMAPKLRVSARIVLAGLAGATLQLFLIKTSSSTSWKHPLTATGLSDVILNIWRVFVPLPTGFFTGYWAWGSNLIDSISTGQSIMVCLSLLLGLVAAGLLLKRPSALFLYVVGVASLWSIQFVVNSGALRHKGFLFMIFVCSLWIGSDSAEEQLSSVRLQRLGDFFGRWRNTFVVSLLAIQVVTGAYAFTADWNNPFSASKQTAQFLRDSGLVNLPILGDRETHVAPVTAYLNKPIYYLQSSRFGTYADLRTTLRELSAQEVLKESLQFARQTRSNVVLVLDSRAIIVQNESTPFTTARINADGLAVSSSAPDQSTCATITMVRQFHCYVDEYYAVYLIQPD